MQPARLHLCLENQCIFLLMRGNNILSQNKDIAAKRENTGVQLGSVAES